MVQERKYLFLADAVARGRDGIDALPVATAETHARPARRV